MAIEGLRRAGADVRVCHVPMWELARHKAGSALSPRGIAGWAGRYSKTSIRLLRAARRESFDCLLAGYPSHIDMPLARAVAGNRAIVFNALISLSDTLVDDRGRFSSGGAAGRALRGLDRVAFSLADRIVMDTECHARLLRDALGVPASKIDVVAVGAEDSFRPIAGVCPPSDRFVVLFYGKLIPLHGLEHVIDAAARLSDEGITFRIVGSGQLEDRVRSEIAGRGIGSVERVDWVDYELLPRELGSAHVALGIFGDRGKALRVVPNKAFQALACGTTLVTADTPAAREVLRDGVDAVLVRPGDGAHLAESILALARDSARRERIGAAGRALFTSRFTQDAIGLAYAKSVEAAVRGRSTTASPTVTDARQATETSADAERCVA